MYVQAFQFINILPLLEKINYFFNNSSDNEFKTSIHSSFFHGRFCQTKYKTKIINTIKCTEKIFTRKSYKHKNLVFLSP